MRQCDVLDGAMVLAGEEKGGGAEALLLKACGVRVEGGKEWTGKERKES